MIFVKYILNFTIIFFLLAGSWAEAETAEDWVNYGNLLYSQGKYEEAIPYYDAAIEMSPSYIRPWYNKGNALYVLGRYEEAIKCYDKILEIDPTYFMAMQYKLKALEAISQSGNVSSGSTEVNDTALQAQNPNVYTGPAVKWDRSMYNNYTYESFSDFRSSDSIIDTENIDTELFCAAIFYATNKERVTEGLPAFEYYYNLECSAQLHANDMVTRFFYAHENPFEPQKKTPSDRMALFDITSGSRSENIAVIGVNPEDTYNSLAQRLLIMWMNSPGHRANILDQTLFLLGCGAAFYYDKENADLPCFKCVQNFCSMKTDDPNPFN